MRTSTAYAAGIAAASLTLFLALPPHRKRQRRQVRAEKAQRENLSEPAIDKTLMDSFPASDPPAWY